MEETLKDKTAKGIFWGAMSNITLQVVGAVFGIILGRILSVEDYGLMAKIIIFQLVAIALQNSGFTVALTNMKAPRDEDFNAVFWFNVGMSVVLYAILFACAPLIAAFYQSPELVALCRYCFLGIVFASLGMAQSAWLFKHLRAKQQAKANMAAVVVSSVIGVSMAYMDMGYWSLATQSILYISVCTLMYWHYSPWRPSVHHVSFAPVRQMFRFSFKILLTTLLTHVNNNILNIVLGRFYSNHEVGQYNQAYQWNSKAFMLVQNVLNQVAQPILIDLKDETERQLNAFRKMMRFGAFISFPLLLGFGMVSQEFILITIGEKWLPSVRLLQILCVSGATFPLITLMSNMIISKGKSGIYLGCTATLGLLQIVLMILLYPYGIRNMVLGYATLNICWVWVWLYFTCRLTDYKPLLFAKDTLPFALAALVVMTATYLLTAFIGNPYLLLVARILIAALLYYGMMRWAKVEILNDCVHFFMRKRA